MADRWPLRNTASADAGRKIVSIYSNGQKTVISTDLPTVRDALNKANIHTSAADVVEPGLDTKIPDGFFNVNIYLAQPYRIVDGQRSILTHSAARSPRLIAQSAGVQVYPQDAISFKPISNVAEAGTVGQDVIIDRAIPVPVMIDGQLVTLRTRGTTVRDLLDDNGIHVTSSDRVSPSLDTKLSPTLHVSVARTRVRLETTDEKISRPVQQVEDNSQPRGYKKVRDAGSDGLQRTTYLVTYNNGAATSKQELKSEVVTAAKPRIEVVGTKVQYSDDAIQLGFDMAAARGWTGAQWDALYNLWMKESKWNPNSINNGSGACGIPQAYPCSKITDKSAAGQIQWGLDYIAGRYSTPAAAWAHWLVYHSY